MKKCFGLTLFFACCMSSLAFAGDDPTRIIADSEEKLAVTCDISKAVYSDETGLKKITAYEKLETINFTRPFEDSNMIAPGVGHSTTTFNLGGMETNPFRFDMFSLRSKGFLEGFVIQITSSKGCEAYVRNCIGGKPIQVLGDLSKPNSKVTLKAFDYLVECRNVMTP